MTDRPYIPIAVPSVGDDEWLALREPLLDGWLTQGPRVRAFEAAFATRHGVAHAIATTSCTTALHLALAAAGIGEGDEVIVPAFTWIATANVVLYCGARPVFVDVEPDTYNIDADALADAVTDRTRAAIPVHLFGRCADVNAVRNALPTGTVIIEDAACAAGASLGGRSAGALGDAGCFSFHPRKAITTGEGGMVTTQDERLAARAERLRNHGAGVPEEVRHGSAAPYLLPTFDELGFNYRMTDLQGAVGLVQLGKLDSFIAERQQWASWYQVQLADIDWLTPPSTPSNGTHAWQSFVAVVSADAPASRNKLLALLHERGIGARPGTHAVTELNYYVKLLGLTPGQFPVASMLQDRSIALPLHNRMTADDYAYVVEVLHEVG